MRDPEYPKYLARAKETVEHLLGVHLAMRLDAAFLGWVGRKTVKELCREGPVDVLKLLNSEKLIESGLLHVLSVNFHRRETTFSPILMVCS